MQSYDEKGTKRFISLSIGKAKKIKAAVKVDLIDGEIPTVYGQLTLAPHTRTEILWLMLDDAGDLTKEQFDDSLTGEVFLAADKAFWEELDFFTLSLRPEMATVLTELKAKAKEVLEMQNTMIVEFANSPEMGTALTQAMENLKAEVTADLPKQLASALASSG